MSHQTAKITGNIVRRLAPHLICAGASDAIEFYKKAFDATEMVRLAEPDGKLMHGAIMINGSMDHACR
jgi:PhnB protein